MRGPGTKGGDAVGKPNNGGRGKRMALAVLAATTALLELSRAIAELIRTL